MKPGATMAAVLAPVALATPALVTPAWAATTDLVVHCDPPLVGPLQAIAAAFRAQTGVRARVFPTMPNGIPAQLAREIQNDIVVTQPEILARIGAAGFLGDIPSSARWRNRIVLAAPRGAAPRGTPQRPIGDATVAAPDPVWGGGLDGPTILAAAALRPGKIAGTYDTAEARALVLSGEAAYALLHASELGMELEALDMPGLTAERIAVAAVSKSPRRPNPEALLRFLATPEAAAILRNAGLEAMS